MNYLDRDKVDNCQNASNDKWCGRKGDPDEGRTETRGSSFPLLFILIADILNNMLGKMVRVHFIHGLPSCTNSMHINLQYVDDTLIFGQGDIREAIYVNGC